ncbi:MAG: hypothetical protein ACXWZX_18210 [Mycobacterium sp.]
MSESPTTATAPRGPGVSMKTETNNRSASTGCGVIITAVPTMAMTNEMASFRISAQ